MDPRSKYKTYNYKTLEDIGVNLHDLGLGRVLKTLYQRHNP